MAEYNLDTPPNARSPSTDRPAVGIRLSPDVRSDAVAGAILRARDAGHEVFVGSEDAADDEVLELAQRRGATVVDATSKNTNGQGIRKVVARVVRSDGFPGLIWQDDPTLEVDFQQSVEQLVDTSDYLLEAQQSVTTPESDEAIISPAATTEQQSVLAIIPAYNERDTIADVVAKTRPYVDKVVVIDDASTDDTAAVAAEYADGVVTHAENLGVGGAVHTGYQVGIREGHDVVIQIDGDGQHDPSYIPELLEEMDETDADMVIGSRWLNGSHQDYSPVRRAGIRFFTFEANVIGGLSITDVTSGFRAYDVEMLADLRRPNNSHWALEQTLEAARKDYTITEVSVPMPPPSDDSQFDLGTLLAYPPRMILITLKVLLYR